MMTYEKGNCPPYAVRKMVGVLIMSLCKMGLLQVRPSFVYLFIPHIPDALTVWMPAGGKAIARAIRGKLSLCA